MSEDNKAVNVNIFDEAVKEGVESIYVNGFHIATGQADVIMILQENGKNIKMMNMSFSLAKTLAGVLSTVIQEFESQTGMTIKTTHEIADSYAND